MICKTQGQANRVALIGASKMAGAGYQAVQSPMNPSVWKVVKADGSFYRVEIGKMPRTCSCSFYRQNFGFKVCKHIVFIEAEAEAQAFCSRLVTASTPMAYATA